MKFRLLLSLIVSVIFLSATAQNFYWAQQLRFDDLDSNRMGRFLLGLDIQGDYALISDPGDFINTYNSGPLSVFDISGGAVQCYKKDTVGNWQLNQRIDPTDSLFNYSFGFSISMDSGQVIIGAPANPKDFMGNDSLSSSGAAYIYNLNNQDTWVEAQKLTANDRERGDRFGYDVEISDEYCFISAAYKNFSLRGDSSLGAIYIFNKNAVGRWSQFQKISPPSVKNWVLGPELDVVGNQLFVAAEYFEYDTIGTSVVFTNNLSYVLVYEQNPLGQFVELQRLVASDSTTSFGGSIAVSDSIAVFGTRKPSAVGFFSSAKNQVYVFNKNSSGLWSEKQILVSPTPTTTGFGSSVDISNNRIVIGDRGNYLNSFNSDSIINAGAVHVFGKSLSGNWQYLQKIVPRDREVEDRFGIGLAIDKEVLIVGSQKLDNVPRLSWKYPIGAAYLFEICNPVYSTETVTACDSFVWNASGRTYFASGVYKTILPDRNNCDSIITLNLTLTTAGKGFVAVEECYEYTWPLNSKTYSKSGIYRAVTKNSKGCDSIVSLDLKIRQGPTETISRTSCKSFTYLKTGDTFTKSGQYKIRVPNVAGQCDSLIILNLVIDTAKVEVLQQGNTLIATTPSLSYQWINCVEDSVLTDETAAILNARVNGSYALIVNKGKCIDTSACFEVTNLGILPNGECDVVSYSPNPTEENVVISLAKVFGTIGVKIYDESGQQIDRQKFLNTGRFKVNLPKAKATYFIVINTNEGCSAGLKVLRL